MIAIVFFCLIQNNSINFENIVNKNLVELPDFSIDEFLQNKPYWALLHPSTIINNTRPLTYHLSSVLFTNISGKGAIRIKDEDSILVLEHNTFCSISSSFEGGCIYFLPGHSIYQKDICARNVYSNIKANYGFINISQTSENINYVSMISLCDCNSMPSINDMIWLGGGVSSISNYNSTNNYVFASPGFYMGYSVGSGNASFINVLSATAKSNSIVYLFSNCDIKYSNFYRNNVTDKLGYYLVAIENKCSADHCVFAYNSAQNFLNAIKFQFSDCSFYQNSINTAPPSIQYVGSYSFVVNTQCHMWNNKYLFKNYSCVIQYFTMDSLIFSFSIFILFT